MKRILTTLVIAVMMAVQANAMSYEQARREALFLTDKMAYELNLTQEQYDAAYEINLDYLMGVTSVDDVYSAYWTRRNLDLSYILLDWQWSAYRAASYFYRPLYWDAGYWHFGVYARYPRRSFFYFDRPAVYVSYRGGHSWHSNGGRSYYMGRRDDFRSGSNNVGMRDHLERGDFRTLRTDGRNSSTRVTVNRDNGNATGSSTFGSSRASGTFGTVRQGASINQSGMNRTSTTARTNGTFSASRGTSQTSSSNYSTVKPSGSTSVFGRGTTGGTFGASRMNTQRQSLPSSSSQSTFGSQRSSGTFSAQRTNTFSAPSVNRTTISPSQSSGSFGSQRSGGSFSSQRSGGNMGGSSSTGGTFSGRR